MSSYQAGYFTGIAVVFIIIFLAIAIVARISRKKGCMKGDFDERQLLERGNAYKYGFMTFLFECFIYILLLNMDFGFMSIIDTNAAVVIGIFIPLTVFVFYSLIHDAFIGYNVNGRRGYIIYILVFVANALSAITNISRGGMIEDGKLSGIGLMNLLLALLFGAILIALYIKSRVNSEKE